MYFRYFFWNLLLLLLWNFVHVVPLLAVRSRERARTVTGEWTPPWANPARRDHSLVWPMSAVVAASWNDGRCGTCRREIIAVCCTNLPTVYLVLVSARPDCKLHGPAVYLLHKQSSPKSHRKKMSSFYSNILHFCPSCTRRLCCARMRCNETELTNWKRAYFAWHSGLLRFDLWGERFLLTFSSPLIAPLWYKQFLYSLFLYPYCVGSPLYQRGAPHIDS